MNKWYVAFIPALITGGPLFMAIAGNAESTYLRLTAYAGAAGLGIGLTLMLRILARQQRVIESLRSELGRAGVLDAGVLDKGGDGPPAVVRPHL